MSPIGRIFSVLNLILAALFLSWAANNVATSHQYKQKFEDSEKAAASAKAEFEDQIAKLRGDLDTKTAEADSARNEAEQAKSAERVTANANSELQTTIDTLTATGQSNASTLSELQSNLDNLQSSKDRAVTAQHEAEGERDDAQQTAQDATTHAAELEAKNAELSKKIDDMNAEIVALNHQISELDTNLATLVDVTGVKLSDVISQSLVNGSVIQANYDVKPGLVALNVGSNDKVQRGYTFHIYNGSQYKGEVRVENVRDDMCTALILNLVPGQKIQQGDRASTRL
ncbi:MAG: hypothetical protein H6828_13550 [Planctomycetes bacterium]|nr:hypothetical protein [Planctomycetota bacterium]